MNILVIIIVLINLIIKTFYKNNIQIQVNQRQQMDQMSQMSQISQMIQIKQMCQMSQMNQCIIVKI